MTRLLGVLRARLLCRRMVHAGLMERDGPRYILTSRGRENGPLRDVVGTGLRVALMTDYARGVLLLIVVGLATLASWALLIGVGYVLIDLAIGWPT
jgi:hypothetical protein